MQLSKICIQKFRSIEKATVNFGRICALVGENNVGKSAILRALNSFFHYNEECEFFENGNHSYRPTSSSVIELHFTGVPKVPVYTKHEIQGSLKVQFKYDCRKKKPEYKYRKNGKWFALPGDLKQQLFKDVNFVLIPNFRSSKQVKTDEKSILKEIIQEELLQHTQKRDRLSPKVREAARILEKNALSKIEKRLENFYSLSHDYTFCLGYSDSVTYRVMLNGIELRILDHEKNFSLYDCGTGIQSLVVIALYRYLAALRHKNIILGVEEPETNLHPQAQKEFIFNIKSNSNSENESQIIFTTHSTTIIDQLDHNDIVLLRKVPDENRGFKTIVNQVREDFFEHNGLDDYKYYQFYRYRNSDFFFSKLIIVVESKTEAEIFKELLKKRKKVDPDLFGISIINLRGIGNLKYPFYLLKELNLDYLIVVDRDFFTPYKDGELNNSRNKDGFPKYKNEFRSDNMNLIKDMIPKETDRKKLLNYLRYNHTKALDLLKQYNIVSMRYTLEIDLVASPKIRENFHDVLKIGDNKRSTHELLVTNASNIKKIQNLMKVLNSLDHQSLPRSYSKVLSIVASKIKTKL